MKTALHIAAYCIFGWAAEHFEGDSQDSNDDLSVLLGYDECQCEGAGRRC